MIRQYEPNKNLISLGLIFSLSDLKTKNDFLSILIELSLLSNDLLFVIFSFLNLFTILSFSELSFRFIELFKQVHTYEFLKIKAYEETGFNTVNYTLGELVRLTKLVANNDSKIQKISTYGDDKLIVEKNGKIYTGMPNTSTRCNLSLMPNLDNVKNFCINMFTLLVLDSMGNIHAVDGRCDHAPNIFQLHKELLENNSWDPTYPIILTKIFSSTHNCLLLTATGDVFKFGINTYGNLAVNDLGNKTNIYLVPELKNIIDIACGNNHSLALDTNGLVYSYGHNTYGELGFEDKKRKRSKSNDYQLGFSDHYRLGEKYYRPRLIPNLFNSIQITVGDCHSIILSKDGLVYSFGNNDHGQLGLKEITMTHIPTLIPELKDIIQIVAGAYHTLALREDGKVYVFGDNGGGHLGILDTPSVRTPVLLQEAVNIKKIWAKDFKSLFITKDDDILHIINGKLVSIGSIHI
jgi:alpha-tubulin suppressor-like RCC1 family protein